MSKGQIIDARATFCDEAMSLYGAVEETHKPIFNAEYAKIASLLDNYFINKNTFYIAYENLYGWPGHYISHIYGIK